MMINLTRKNISATFRNFSIVRVFERCEVLLRHIYGALYKRLSPAVNVYRHKDTLTIAHASRLGGHVVIVSIAEGGGRADRGLTVRHEGMSLMIADTRIDYEDVANARTAFEQVRRVLLPASFGVWIKRLLGLVLAWVFCRILFAAMWGVPAATAAPLTFDSDLQGRAAEMDGSNARYAPSEPLPQSMPGEVVGGDLADRIYRESQAAAEANMHETLPPQPAADVEGLNGFGLEDGPGKNGPGCDPELAFKVDR